MTDEIETLRQRIRELELIERDYSQLKNLIDSAEKSESLDRYRGTAVLYVEPGSLRILEANPFTAEVLGYPLEQLYRLSVADVEVSHHSSHASSRSYIETSFEEEFYACAYRHRDGYLIPVNVSKRMLKRNNALVWYYMLEDVSLYRRVWRELDRREQTDFQFQQKLKILNEINFALHHIDSFDELCWRCVKLGVERLGFDRLSLWFLNKSRDRMVGSYGVDEYGNIRDERQQSWTFDQTHVIEFMAGKTDPFITYDEAPLYNEKSEILGYGWHISVPMLNGEQFIGYIAADNFVHHQPMSNYEPELLRLYGITVGHLAALTQARSQSLELRFEQEQVRMLKTFIMDIGHDFRTPLTVIQTNAYLLEKIKNDERKQTLARIIREQTDHITNMLNDMLDIVKLEYEQEFNLEPVDIRSLLQLVKMTHDTAAAAKKITLTVEVDTDMMIRGDVQYLKQALDSIVKNAVQYTPSEGRVLLQGRTEDHRVIIRVQDTGIGIDPQHFDRIFKPFYRIDEARTQRGSGLGLPIAKLIIEAHQGHITVESTVGEGSTFEIVLPDGQTA